MHAPASTMVSVVRSIKTWSVYRAAAAAADIPIASAAAHRATHARSDTSRRTALGANWASTDVFMATSAHYERVAGARSG